MIGRFYCWFHCRARGQVIFTGILSVSLANSPGFTTCCFDR